MLMLLFSLIIICQLDVGYGYFIWLNMCGLFNNKQQMAKLAEHFAGEASTGSLVWSCPH